MVNYVRKLDVLEKMELVTNREVVTVPWVSVLVTQDGEEMTVPHPPVLEHLNVVVSVI